MASGDFTKKLAEITDKAELNKMLDETTDFMERIALEDRLESLGQKQDLGFKGATPSPSPSTPSTSAKKPEVSSLRTPGSTGKRLSSHTFSSGDKANRSAPRPSMMSTLATTKQPLRGTKSALTPDEASSGTLSPLGTAPTASRGLGGGGLVRSASQAKEQIMLWAQKCTMTHGIPVKNMTSSFSDGVAFCAIVHFYFPNAFAFEDCLKMPRKERITFAFQKAEELGGVPQLIDPEDLILMGKKPDYKVMFTYMSEMYRNLKKLEAIPQIK